jgi:hypothetical protein
MAFGRNNDSHNNDDDTTPETPDPEVAQAEAVVAAAAAGEVDPWAFLANEGVVAPTTFVKPPPVEEDVPLALRTAVETALAANTAYRIGFPNADLVKPALKHFKAYGIARKAGRIVVRASVQRDGVTIHLTAKRPVVKVPAATETA